MNVIKLKYKNFATIKISNDNQYLAAATSNKVFIYDFDSLKIIAQFGEIRNPSYIQFSSDNKLLAIKSTSGAIGLFSLESFSFLRKFKCFKDAGDGSDISFTPDNQFIIDGDWLGNIRLINIEDGVITVFEKNENTMISNIEYDENERVFHILKFYRGGLSIIDESSHSVSRWKYNIDEKRLLFLDETRKLSRGLGDDLLFNKEKRFYVCTNCKSRKNKQLEIVLYNYMLDSIIFSRNIEGEVNNFYTKSSLSSNGAYFGIAFDNKVQIYSTEEFALEKEVNIESPSHINFSYDNKYFYATSQNGNAFIYSLKNEDLSNYQENSSDLTENFDYGNLLKDNFNLETIKQIPDEVLAEVIKDYALNNLDKKIDEFEEEVIKVFYCTWWFECEESEGGIYQYFYNNGDKDSLNQLMDALILINAEKTLGFVKKVYDELSEKEFEDINWDQYQEMFDEITEDIDSLRIKYIRNK